MSAALLEVDGINTYYGESHILRDLSIRVEAGEIVALLGRNGVGKTTVLKSICGWVPPRSGAIAFEGTPIDGKRMMEIARLGVSLVPEERRIFTNLTVAENLRLAQVTSRRTGWTLERIYEKFPRLAERLRQKGDEISGGEKQMLAIARALVQDARLILLDEPSEGLAPLIVREVENVVREIKASGTTVLLVEQNLYSALALSDRCYVIEQGQVRMHGTPDELRRDETALARYLHV